MSCRNCRAGSSGPSWELASSLAIIARSLQMPFAWNFPKMTPIDHFYIPWGLWGIVPGSLILFLLWESGLRLYLNAAGWKEFKLRPGHIVNDYGPSLKWQLNVSSCKPYSIHTERTFWLCSASSSSFDSPSFPATSISLSDPYIARISLNPKPLNPEP